MANEVNEKELEVSENEVFEVAEDENTEVVIVKKEKLWTKVKRGAKTTWSKIPKPIKVGMGVVATSAAAFMLGKKVAKNSIENDANDANEDQYDDTEFEEYVEGNTDEATAEEVSEEV